MPSLQIKWERVPVDQGGIAAALHNNNLTICLIYAPPCRSLQPYSEVSGYTAMVRILVWGFFSFNRSDLCDVC